MDGKLDYLKKQNGLEEDVGIHSENLDLQAGMQALQERLGTKRTSARMQLTVLQITANL